MQQRKIFISVTLILALAAAGALAQGAQRDRHHPGTASSAPASNPAATAQGMPMGGSPGGMSMMGGMPMMGMMRMMMAQMAGHIEGRIAFLKVELKITEAQSFQWNRFAEALLADARRMTAARGTMSGMMGQGGAAISAPERLDRIEKMMTAMLESVRATRAALTPLYAVLTDEQKKLADDLIRGPMGMPGPMGMMGSM